MSEPHLTNVLQSISFHLRIHSRILYASNENLSSLCPWKELPMQLHYSRPEFPCFEEMRWRKKIRFIEASTAEEYNCLHHYESAGHLWFIGNTIKFSKTHIFTNIQEQPYSNLIHSLNSLLTIQRLRGQVIFWAIYCSGFSWHMGSVGPAQHVGSSWTREGTRVSRTGRWILYHWATGEAHSRTWAPWRKKLHPQHLEKQLFSQSTPLWDQWPWDVGRVHRKMIFEEGLEGDRSLPGREGFAEWRSNVNYYVQSSDLLYINVPCFSPCTNILQGILRWLSGKECACQCRRCKRCRFDLWVGIASGNIPVFSPAKSQGQRTLEGYSSWSHRVGHDWAGTHTHKYLVSRGFLLLSLYQVPRAQVLLLV